MLQSSEGPVLGAARRRVARLRCLLASVALLGCALAAATFPDAASAARTLPKDASFGKLTAFAYPYASIGGKTWRMSPGAKIYNEQNLIIMPAAMRQRAKVLYRLDSAGSLSGIWLLTESEAAAFERRAPGTKPSAGTKPGAGTKPSAGTTPAGGAQ